MEHRSNQFFLDCQTGARETELNSFQNDVDDYLERFARMAGDKRETAEQFILQVVLSGLEKAHDRPGYRAMDSYRVLAKLSCCKNSPSVVKHSLSQLLNLLSRWAVNITSCMSVCSYVCLNFCPSACLIYLLSVGLSVCLPAFLSVCLFV